MLGVPCDGGAADLRDAALTATAAFIVDVERGLGLAQRDAQALADECRGALMRDGALGGLSRLRQVERIGMLDAGDA